MTDRVGNPGARLPQPGEIVVAAGVGVTGLPVVRYLASRGAVVIATSQRPAPPELALIAADTGATITFAGDLQQVPPNASMVVTSAGIPPHHPLLASAVAAGVEVIGEAELAWRLDHAPGARPRPWLVVTGTNGKTTTIGMLEAMLRADGRQVTACGNVGWAVLSAVLAGDPRSDPDDLRQDVIAVELSSFQLHYAPSIVPTAGLVLNVAEDHLDWHGSMAAYAQAKALALAGEVAVAVVDDPAAAGLLGDSPAPVHIAVSAKGTAPGQVGLRDGRVIGPDGAPVFEVSDVQLPGPHNLTNAMAAAALALAVQVPAAAIGAALRGFTPTVHRQQWVADVDGVGYVNDSKATNPHAALASLMAYERVVWIAGGQLKGASVSDLVASVASRLVGVVLLGVDAPVIAAAVARHAPDVPRITVSSTDDGAMDEAVRAAARMAAPGTTVLMAPAAASLDMFSSYGARGDAFIAAVRELADQERS